MDAWIEYLKIIQHPFLERFKNDYVISTMYENAVRGWPRFIMGRPEHWYDTAMNTQAAIDRLVEMITSRLAVASPELVADLVLLLEDCEEEGSIDLIGKIRQYFPRSRDEMDGEPAKGEPATEKQRSYLRKLGAPNFSGTKGEASELIEQLKSQTHKR